jgi:hypothetical protein
MKKIYLLIICQLLFFGQRTSGESVTQKVHFSQAELKCDTIIGEDGLVYNLLSYPGIENDHYAIGAPALPIKYVTIPLPYTADDISLNVRYFNTTSYEISKRIFPIQEQEVTSLENTRKGFIPCDNFIYGSVAPYPSEQARIAEISCVGYGGRLVVVVVNPITYIPAENRYDFSEDIELTLTYSHSSKRVEALTHNTRTVNIGIPFYEYCVITSQNLKDAFTRLIAWKREKGLSAGVVCKEEILDNTFCSVGDTVSSICDDAGKIRQYLQYAYASGVTKYVLFGGNYSILPIRYGTGSNNKWTVDSLHPNDYKVPSDFYFSELNSNWKTDDDEYYGEYSDNLDSGSELYVGRLLCTNSEEIHNYTDKLLRYEMNPGNGDFSYLKKALYTQLDQMQRNHEQENIATQLQTIFPIDTIFSEQPSYYDLNPTSPYGNVVIAKLNEHYGYVSWGGHGGPHNITVKSDSVNRDNWYAITSVQTNVPFITPESANGLDNLTNKDYPMFAYSISCSITPFDNYDNYSQLPNMGQSFTLGKDYGGPVLVGNTRYGWVGSSASLQKRFNECLFVEPMVGYAQNYAKLNYNNHFLRHSSNIIGCPNIRIWTDIPTLFSATLSYNSNNYVITANNYITDAEIGVRDITLTNEVIDVISFNPSQGSKTLSNVANSLITLTGKNCLPQIMPLTIQNATLHGTHYAIVKDVSCGKDVRSGTQGDVTFEQDSNYTFETKGTFELTRGVEIELGAQLTVIPSEISY